MTWEIVRLTIAQVLWGLLLASIITGLIAGWRDYRRFSREYDERTCCWGCTPEHPVAPCTLHTD